MSGNVTNLEFKDGDDDDDFDNVTGGVNIEPVDNGWIVNVINDEGDIRKVYEYKNGALMMKFLTEVLGLKYRM